MSQSTQVSASKQSKKHMRFWRYGAMLRKPSQATRLLLHLHWNRGGSTDGTDSDKGLTNEDCSNGILSFLALSPVFSFHLYIKIGLWISTEPTASSTRRLSWMKREKSVTMSWIRWFTRILFLERIGVWSIDNKYNTIWGWIVPHMETTQPHLLVFFQILLKKPSYSSSNIFQMPFLRPPSLTINLRSESCLRYRYTCRREMPMFSDICMALIWGVCEINL